MTAIDPTLVVRRRHAPGGVLVVGFAAAVVAGSLGPLTLLLATVSLVGIAAAEDIRSSQIPNELVVALVFAGLARAIILIVTDHGLVKIAAGILTGIVLSGGLAMFVLWLVRPHSIGGGDWKLTMAVGVALGLIDMAAAAVVGVVAVLMQLAASAVLRRRMMPFAPALLAGTLAAALAMSWLVTPVGLP